MTSIHMALTEAYKTLAPIQSEARLESEILLSHVLQKNRAYLYAHNDALLNSEQLELYRQLVNKRLYGYPIAYLTGTRSFWSLELKVTPDTLIPRHETELLVELILNLLPDVPNTKILDLGTGSGAIALAIAKERPTWSVDACDISAKALEIAKENASTHDIHNVNFYLSNWFQDLPQTRYHVIVSNPPYIRKDDPHLEQGDLRHEPIHALVSEGEGLADIRHLLTKAKDHLLPNGLILIEHGYDQKSQIQSIINAMSYRNVQCWQDTLGHDRVSGGYI